MIEIQITEELLTGYAKPVFCFACPMCEEDPIQNFIKGCVRDEAWRHLVVEHRILAKKIDLVTVSLDALEGMKKVGLPHSGSGV